MPRACIDGGSSEQEDYGGTEVQTSRENKGKSGISEGRILSLGCREKNSSGLRKRKKGPSIQKSVLGKSSFHRDAIKKKKKEKTKKKKTTEKKKKKKKKKKKTTQKKKKPKKKRKKTKKKKKKQKKTARKQENKKENSNQRQQQNRGLKKKNTKHFLVPFPSSY